MKKYYYSYDEFKDDVKELVELTKPYNADTYLAIARGGLTLGHFMANALDTRRLYTLNSIHYNGEEKLDTFDIFNVPSLDDAKRVLIIDDIIDSGETMREIIKLLKVKYPNTEFKTATIFYKTSAILKADFALKEAKEWIDFFWEVDCL